MGSPVVVIFAAAPTQRCGGQQLAAGVGFAPYAGRAFSSGVPGAGAPTTGAAVRCALVGGACAAAALVDDMPMPIADATGRAV